MKILLLTLLVASAWANIEWPEAKPLETLREEEEKDQSHVVSLVSEGKKNFFDYVGIGLNELFDDLAELEDKDLGLDNTTESGFNAEIEKHMKMVGSDLCADYNTTNECKSSIIMGCNCHDHFGKIENDSCRQSPCFIVKHIWNNAAASLSDLRSVKDVEDLVNLGVKFANPILKMMCGCNPSVYEATMSCVKNYNGAIVERKHKKEFRKFVKKLKLDALKDVLSTMTGAYCGHNATCMGDFNEMVLHLAGMLDRSVAGEQNDTCNNFRRMSDTIMAFIMDLMDKEKEHTIDSVLSESTKLPKNFWCGEKDCKEYLSKAFNDNCCYRDAVKKIDLRLLKNFLKYFKSLLRASKSKWMPKISKKTLKKIVKAADPAKMCKRMYKAQCNEA